MPENTKHHKLLGPKCQSLAYTYVQMQLHGHWCCVDVDDLFLFIWLYLLVILEFPGIACFFVVFQAFFILPGIPLLYLWSTDHPTFFLAGGPVLRTLHMPLSLCNIV